MESCIKIKPFFISKPWGGDHLRIVAKRRSESNEIALQDIGEMILLSTIDQFPTYIETGSYAGKKFQEYWEEEGRLIYQRYTDEETTGLFPFLLKVLSTNEPLSIQVHPSKEDLKNNFNIDDNGKFESWIILKADEEATIYLGLKKEYGLKDLGALNQNKNLLSLFNTYYPKQGDIYKLEPGLIHGTKGKLLFFEIQEPSDHTFRIYDFNRKRDLHIEEALKVVKNNSPQVHDWTTSLSCPAFNVNIKKAVHQKIYKTEKPFCVFNYFGPPGKILGDFGEWEIEWGDTFLCWSETDFKFEESTSIPSSELPLTKLNEALFFLSSV